jgi:hypothetical protein
MDFPENGTRNAGRAGASVAKVDDPSAIVINPAGLASVKGTNLLFNNNLTIQDLCFDRAGTYIGDPAPRSFAGQPFPKVCRMFKGVFYAPMIAASYDFGLKNWTFALGGYGPSAVGVRRFPRHVTVRDSLGELVRAPGPARYDTDEMNVVVLFFTLAAAWRPAPWLDLGLAIQPTLVEVKFSTLIPGNTGRYPDPDFDVYFHIHNYGFDVASLLGAKIRPIDQLEFGLSLRLPVHAQTKGDVTIKLPPSMTGFGGSIRFGEGAQGKMVSDLPLYLRMGLRYKFLTGPKEKPVEIADIELDFQWERWSAIRTMDTAVNAELIGRQMDVFRLPHFYRDTISIRLGGSFTVPRPVLGGKLTFSAGTFYDTSASPLEYTRLDYQAFALMGFALGVAYKVRGIELQLSYVQIWGGWGKPWNFKRKRRVERSCINPVNPYDAPEAVRCNPFDDSTYNADWDVGRGTYEMTYSIVSLGFQVTFEEMISGKPVKR